MNWALSILLIIVIGFMVTNYRKKKRLQKLKLDLTNNWSKPKQDVYFNLDAIRKYFDNNQHKESAFHIISDKTASDLDLDAIFKFLDRTTSKIGQQYLYYKLRTA